MNKGKIVAIVTGVISIAIAIAYLIVVQLLDFRGEMLPAPTGQLPLVGLENYAIVYSIPAIEVEDRSY
jgi:hypothetical protein